MPQKTPVLDILSPKPQIATRKTSQAGAKRLQIDKMPEKEIFHEVCCNEKKAVTLSQSKKRYSRTTILLFYNF